MNMLMKIFAGIGFLALFIGIIYLIKKGMTSSSPSTLQSETYPPNDYMYNIGSKCPDMWTNIGYKMIDSKQYVICRNDYHVPISSSTCYKDPNAKTMNFENIGEWPILPSDQTNVLKSRCDWIKSCGPITGSRASWTGIVDKCT